MPSENVPTGEDCKQFFAAFDQIKADNSPSTNTGLTVFQVEDLLGRPNKVSSGVGHNLYMYSVGSCRAEIEFVNGRTVRKTFAIVGNPVPQAQPEPPPAMLSQAGLIWALVTLTAILLIALVWSLVKHRRAPDYPQSQPVELQPIEHNLLLTPTADDRATATEGGKRFPPRGTKQVRATDYKVR